MDFDMRLKRLNVCSRPVGEKLNLAKRLIELDFSQLSARIPMVDILWEGVCSHDFSVVTITNSSACAAWILLLPWCLQHHRMFRGGWHDILGCHV